MPSFVRRAERARRWREPRVRAALAAAAGALALLLAVQAALEYRDLIAAKSAAGRSLVTALCAAAGCRVGAPLAIESLAVESSGLVRVEKSALYRLNVALRNRAPHEVALPAVELTLSNAQGAVIARRVLRPAEFGVQQATVGAGRDVALQATLQTAFQPASETIAGYTIELFYP